VVTYAEMKLVVVESPTNSQKTSKQARQLHSKPESAARSSAKGPGHSGQQEGSSASKRSRSRPRKDTTGMQIEDSRASDATPAEDEKAGGARLVGGGAVGAVGAGDATSDVSDLMNSPRSLRSARWDTEASRAAAANQNMARGQGAMASPTTTTHTHNHTHTHTHTNTHTRGTRLPSNSPATCFRSLSLSLSPDCRTRRSGASHDSNKHKQHLSFGSAEKLTRPSATRTRHAQSPPSAALNFSSSSEKTRAQRALKTEIAQETSSRQATTVDGEASSLSACGGGCPALCGGEGEGGQVCKEAGCGGGVAGPPPDASSCIPIVPPSITSPTCLRSAARPRRGGCHALGGGGEGQGCEEVARAAACAPRAAGRLLPL
jgi:hypothetical protein